jgi:aldose 1-epimerase
VIELIGRDLQVGVVALGARLARVRVPDRGGVLGDVLLGMDDYTADAAYLGATVGRYANRIAGGAFVLDGERYTVPVNEGSGDRAVALHGGADGFDRHEFTADPVVPGKYGSKSVTLRRTSPAGESGFPGTLEVAVTYSLNGPELSIEHTATTDAPTVVNLTNHGYWNLTGRGGPVENHLVRIVADRYLPVDERLIPTGELAPVEGTPFDLRTPVRLGTHLRASHPQLLATRGYDHTFVLDRPADGDLALAAVVDERTSGRWLRVHTDQPGLQLNTGNFLDGTIVLRGGTTARQGDAFCLEAQAFPNAPNEPGFPSTVLRPGETYRSRIMLRFGAS